MHLRISAVTLFDFSLRPGRISRPLNIFLLTIKFVTLMQKWPLSNAAASKVIEFPIYLFMNSFSEYLSAPLYLGRLLKKNKKNAATS